MEKFLVHFFENYILCSILTVWVCSYFLLELDTCHSAIYIVWTLLYFLSFSCFLDTFFYLQFYCIDLVCCQTHYIFVYVVVFIYHHLAVFQIYCVHFLYLAVFFFLFVFVFWIYFQAWEVMIILPHEWQHATWVLIMLSVNCTASCLLYLFFFFFFCLLNLVIFHFELFIGLKD